MGGKPGMKKKRARSQPVSGRTAPAPAPATGGRVQVGDVVDRKPISFSDSDAKNAQTMRGTVVWVHPAGRFHVVEFEKGVRESFMGVQR